MAQRENAIIPDFQVNENSLISSIIQDNPSISADSTGNFIVTWTDLRSGGTDVYAQRYASDGTIIGNNFKVSDDTSNTWQGYPDISVGGSGNFIIVWQDERTGELDIYFCF